MTEIPFGLTSLDLILFAGYVVVVVLFALFMSRREKTSEDYFLAGRRLTWFLIGISLIASNISTEHFVGMAGAGFETGLAIACYEWTAAVAIVIVGLFLLPRFLQRGIFTIPQFLEYRYSAGTRGLMAFYMMAAYVFVIISAVLYAGAVGLDTIFGDSIRGFFESTNWASQLDLPGLLGSKWVLILCVWAIGLVAGIYTVWGGLKAVVWADLINGLALILGGIFITVLGFAALTDQLGGGNWLQGMTVFFERAGDKLSAVKPWNHPEVPWIAVFIGGLWIPQFFYWGLNQFITQRALGARSVAQGQKGLVFAAFLKILMPFIIIFPGIIAYELYAQQIDDKDRAFPHLIRTILGPGFRGLMLAALFGAVMSSLDSMLNSASTIATIDLYKRHWKKQASERTLVRLGRLLTALFVVVACLWAPQLGWIAGGKGVFDYIQKTWGFITPGIVTVFFFGLVFRRAPAQAAMGAMLLGPTFYMWCLLAMPETAFLHHMAFTFGVLSLYMLIVSLLTPMRQETALPIDLSGATEASPEGGRSGESATFGEPESPRGFLRFYFIPIVTVAVGCCWMAPALFAFSWNVLTRIYHMSQLGELPTWLPFVTTLVPTAIYFLVGIWLLRLPFSQTRYVLGSEEGVRLSIGRLLRVFVGMLVLSVLIGIHVYMFSVLALKPVTEPTTAVGTLYRQLWDQSVQVTVPVLWHAQPPGSVSVSVGEPIPLGLLELTFQTLELNLMPLLFAVVIGGIFFLGGFVLWAMGWRPSREPESTVPLDLTPSRGAAFFGVLVILGVLTVYYFFF